MMCGNTRISTNNFSLALAADVKIWQFRIASNLELDLELNLDHPVSNRHSLCSPPTNALVTVPQPVPEPVGVHAVPSQFVEEPAMLDAVEGL